EPILERVLLNKALEALDRGREWLQVLAMPKVVERLASFLLIFCRDAPHEQLLGLQRPNALHIRLPMGRVDLAHYLGTRAESISRAIHALRDNGTIQINTPNDFDILDLARLADIATLELSAPDVEALRALRNASVVSGCSLHLSGTKGSQICGTAAA
uniref:Crp/Fnr family transcriptional regulator n=1 Tax=Solirhodobacter olei TaxID=2493082 RepID=UPI0019D43F17